VNGLSVQKDQEIKFHYSSLLMQLIEELGCVFCSLTLIPEDQKSLIIPISSLELKSNLLLSFAYCLRMEEV